MEFLIDYAFEQNCFEFSKQKKGLYPTEGYYWLNLAKYTFWWEKFFSQNNRKWAVRIDTVFLIFMDINGVISKHFIIHEQPITLLISCPKRLKWNMVDKMRFWEKCVGKYEMLFDLQTCFWLPWKFLSFTLRSVFPDIVKLLNNDFAWLALTSVLIYES